MAAPTLPITPPGVITQEFRTPVAVRRGIIAGVVGNMLEWYDFALFGFFAQQIGTHFFPADDPTASLLAAFGTFAAGFLMRPVGGVLFGWVGDRFGRKQALIWSVLAMAFPSFFIGVLPGTATIGLAAPMMAYGWRIPFIIGLAVGLGGLAIRRHYIERVPHQAPAKSPLKEAFATHWRTMLHLVALVSAISVGFYTTFVYAATWLVQVAQVPARTALEINTLAMALSLLVLPLSGLASDRLGRRPVLLLTSGAFALLAYPLMALMARGATGGILVGYVGLALLVSAVGGLMPATMAELAPRRVRCTVLSVAYNVGMALLGGTTPLVAAWLVARTGVALAPAMYLTGAAAVTFVAALLLPKSARHRLTKEFEAARFR
jgi:MHS family proline/betaine transporter-like MFS transporter